MPLYGNGAVRRNRLKRRMREIARLHVLPHLDLADAHVDVLMRARREAYQADFEQLRDEIIRWLDRRWPPGPRSG